MALEEARLAHEGELDRAIPLSTDGSAREELVQALFAAGRLAEAKEQARLVVSLNPGSAVGWVQLGRLALGAGSYEEAKTCCSRALEIKPDSVDAHMLADMAKSEGGYSLEAIEHWQSVLAMTPEHGAANGLIGLALQEHGRFEEAVRYLERSIAAWPTNGLAYYALARSRRLGEEDRAWLEEVERARQDPRASKLERSYLSYALGKAHEDLREYEASFRHYEEANRSAFEHWFSGRPWDRRRQTEFVDRMISLNLPRDSEFHDERPVFIIGMIRSGTTLVEQIVSAHPDVAAGGEITFWYKHLAGALGGADLAGEYLKWLDAISPTAKRITNKLPYNFDVAGLIYSALPNARFIHVKRDPLDNCVSIFTTAYQKPPAFALDKGNIVFAFREYERVMEHWRRVIPASSMLEIRYEELTSNPSDVVPKVIAFLGLPWRDECLKPERNPRSVHTPSAWQVRQPVYAGSVGRWRRFEPWLGEFLELGQ